MANAQQGNMAFIDDTTSPVEVSTYPTNVYYIIITATSANMTVDILDNASSPAQVLDLEISSSGDTKQFSFETNPLHFPNGVRVDNLGNGDVTIVYGRTT
jgi:hypothetical protein